MRSVTNLFLLNIAFTDIVKAIVFVPFNYIPNLLYNYWPFGSFMCSLVGYIQVVAVLGGTITMVAMSFDRFVAILHPLRPKLTFKGVGLISLLVWIIAFTIPLPTALFSQLYVPPANDSHYCSLGYCMETMDISVKQIYSLFIMFVQYFIPLMVLAYTYGRIGYVIWIKTIPGEALQRRDERIAYSKRKMIKMMIVVVVLYAVCWLPCHLLTIIGDANDAIYNWNDIKYVFNSAFLLAASHSCCNPIVYVWMNKRFMNGFKKIFMACLCCIKSGFKSRRGLIGQTSYSMSVRRHPY
ncbi:hypothetical protein FSP39_019456 [Pinctada imbricata]|uniref:G-protein coupled receptors family 1 profile domain-containing protein n=1 Tax=Pinctada imbricata TaxID=66713 RepID=A0AA88XTB7_PINIB|nr:hypothetical protein FSP39_019456 [Pinctada imbricata]